MSCVEHLSAAASHVLDGVMYHEAVMDLFDFLGLKGFYKWQKHQMHEELSNFEYLKHFAHKTHHMFLEVSSDSDALTVIPDSWKTRSSLEATMADCSSAVKKVLENYILWEQAALEAYAALAEDMSAGPDKTLICQLYTDTCEELHQVENLAKTLQMTNYNALHIQLIQDKFCEKYK